MFRRCSDKSQPNTLSLRMPDFFSLPLEGRDKMKLRKNDISFPCFRKTGLETSMESSESLSMEVVSLLLTDSFSLMFCGDFVPDHLDVLAWKESDLESTFASPPGGLIRGGHVNHRYHVTNPENWLGFLAAACYGYLIVHIMQSKWILMMLCISNHLIAFLIT